jgi:hypothetical protein
MGDRVALDLHLQQRSLQIRGHGVWLSKEGLQQCFSNWRTAARFRLLKLVFVHMAEYTTYYTYTTDGYLSTPNGVLPGFDSGTPSISPDMDGEVGTLPKNCYWSETFCLK